MAILKRYLHSMFSCSIIHNNQSKCPSTDEQIKMWYRRLSYEHQHFAPGILLGRSGARPRAVPEASELDLAQRKQGQTLLFYHPASIFIPWGFCMGFAGDKPLLCLVSCSSLCGFEGTLRAWIFFRELLPAEHGWPEGRRGTSL